MSQSLPPIIFDALHDDVSPPARQTTDAAGYDLRAYLRGRQVQVRRADSGAIASVAVDGALELHPGDVALVQ